MAEQDLNQNIVLISGTLLFKLLFKTSVLVAASAESIIQLDAFMQFTQSYPSGAACSDDRRVPANTSPCLNRKLVGLSPY